MADSDRHVVATAVLIMKQRREGGREPKSLARVIWLFKGGTRIPLVPEKDLVTSAAPLLPPRRHLGRVKSTKALLSDAVQTPALLYTRDSQFLHLENGNDNKQQQ